MDHASRESLPALYLRLGVEVDVTPESFSKFLVVNVTYKKSHTIIVYLAKYYSKLFHVPQVVSSWGILAPSSPRSRHLLLPRQADKDTEAQGTLLAQSQQGDAGAKMSTQVAPSPGSLWLSYGQGYSLYPFLWCNRLNCLHAILCVHLLPPLPAVDLSSSFIPSWPTEALLRCQCGQPPSCSTTLRLRLAVNL